MMSKSNANTGTNEVPDTKDTRAVAAKSGFGIAVHDQSGTRRVTLVDARVHTIGSSKDNDIPVSGDGIDDVHLHLVIPDYVGDGIRIIPQSAPVEIVGFGLLEKGHFADVEPGTTIRFEDASLQIARSMSAGKTDRVLSRSLAAACILLIIALTWTWYSGLVAEAPTTRTAALDNAAADNGQTLTLSDAVNPDLNPERLEALAWTVRTRLEDLGIGDGLTVVPTLNGALRVSGTLTDQNNAQWQSFLNWYSTRNSYPPLVEEINQIEQARDVPELNSIWLDDQPSVVFRSGSIGKVGSEIENGWIVVSISRNAVVLTRDGAYITLKF